MEEVHNSAQYSTPISQLGKITRKIFQIWSALAGYKDQCREIKANGKLRTILNEKYQQYGAFQ